MSVIITEDDIFKYLVPHESVDMDLNDNIRGFLSDLPVNIFKDEYYILYKAIQFGYKYKIVININHLEQIVLSNMDDFLKDKNITMYKDGEEEYTDNERAILIQQSVSSTYEMLQDMEVDVESPYKAMRFNLKLYIKEWVKDEYNKTLIAQNNILNEGAIYNGRKYKGIEDANAYGQKKYELLRTLIEGDVNRLSDVIDTSEDSTEEVKEKMKEDSYEILANTGIEEWDKYYPLSRGEIIVIQGGSGAGKTRQGVNIAHNGLTQYKSNVLVLTLEQKASRVMPMFISKHSTRLFNSQSEWLADKSIIRNELNENQELMMEYVLDDLINNSEYGKLRIEGIDLHAKNVRNYLNKVWDDGFHFDIVMLDYIGILDTAGEKRYEVLTEVVNNFKSDCKTFKGDGFLAILPNQLTNKAEESLHKGDYDMSSTGGSETSYLRRGSDYVYTVHQDDEMKATNRMKMIIEKVRLGDPIVGTLDILAFQGQCLYLSDNLEEEESELA